MSEEIKELLFLLHNDRLTKSGKRKIEQEIERLNNIINELEKWLLWRYENGSESISFRESFLFVIDKIKELKGDSSNE